jgi:hypothetical protein
MLWAGTVAGVFPKGTKRRSALLANGPKIVRVVAGPLAPELLTLHYQRDAVPLNGSSASGATAASLIQDHSSQERVDAVARSNRRLGPVVLGSADLLDDEPLVQFPKSKVQIGERILRHTLPR